LLGSWAQCRSHGEPTGENRRPGVAAEDAIKKAEAMKLTPDAQGLIDKANALVAEAKAHHTDARAKIDHANAMWKARAAQAQAEAAAALSPP
jgi:hypothetical protein